MDYFSKWLQEKRKALNELRTTGARGGNAGSQLEEVTGVGQISSVERMMGLIPAEVISRRAMECGSYARALFHWEQFIRHQNDLAHARGQSEPADEDAMLQHLQDIYAQIDEPDCMEGISAHLRTLNPEEQVLEHRRAGRWAAAQAWYEMELAETPADPGLQRDLISCLKEAGKYSEFTTDARSTPLNNTIRSFAGLCSVS